MQCRFRAYGYSWGDDQTHERFIGPVLRALIAQEEETTNRIVAGHTSDIKEANAAFRAIEIENDQLRSQLAAQGELLSRFQYGGAEACEAAREDLIEELQAKVSALTQAAGEREMEWCSDCGGLLTNCGEQDDDGEPALDCNLCQLRGTIDKLRAEVARLEGDKETMQAGWAAVVEVSNDTMRALCAELATARDHAHELSAELDISKETVIRLDLANAGLWSALEACVRPWYNPSEPGDQSRAMEAAREALSAKPGAIAEQVRHLFSEIKGCLGTEGLATRPNTRRAIDAALKLLGGARE